MIKGEGARAAARFARVGQRTVRKPWTTMVAVAVVPALLAVLAFINPGVKVSQLDLNDGSVWLTNMSELKLGRFNAQISELNAGLVTTGATFDVAQEAADVLLIEPARVSRVDPAGVALLAQVPVPAGTDVSMAGGVVALSAPDGRVWVSTLEQLSAFDPEQIASTWDLGPGALSTVTESGAALAVDPQTGIAHRAQFVDDALQLEELGEVAGTAGAVLQQIAAVGDELVVLSERTLHGVGWEVDLSSFGSEFALQQSGPQSDMALVAGPTDLLRVPVSGRHAGKRDRVESVGTGSSGRPSQPVRVGDCEYGAWAAAKGNYVQRCDDADLVTADLDGISARDELVFRVNRAVVVLNDVRGGRVWLPDDVPQMQEPNWTDIESQENPEDAEDISEEVETTQNLMAECSEIASAPEAKDDQIGVRTGRMSVLNVLDNDISAECGIIAISEFEQIPEAFGKVEKIYGGRALQVRVKPNAKGSVSFTYAISDGGKVNAPSTATVTLTVAPDNTNRAPEQVRQPTVDVELGAAVKVNVLADFVDPDGDDLQLVSAVTSGESTVRVRPDGIMTFLADGEKLGRHVVAVQVSDGAETTEGKVMVDVRPAGSLVPKIDPVHAIAYVDQAVDVDVMSHVRSASREPARLAGVDAVEGTEVTMDSESGTFEFTASRPGPYYIPFVVATSTQQASGLARIDVQERPEEPLPPVAVRDTALLPAGGEVTIDPLANDHDPNGGVLVLVSAIASENSPLRVSVLEHRYLRISSKRVLEKPELIEYVVSNGVFEVRGEVLVHPVPPAAGQRPPVVQDIDVSVRTGGVVTIPVLEFASDPDGDEITLDRKLAEEVSAGLLFVSGDRLRYQAPSEPTTAHAIFTVTDSAGNSTSAKLTISVRSSDPERKEPPRPRDLTARVFDGEVVRISVPLLGIDDDGDGVSLLGEATAPEKGRIVAVGADYLEYEAFPGESGTDSFTYAVEDWVGQRAVATVRVGIAKRSAESMPIVTHDDVVTVQPGERVEVRVLLNDDNPGGGELELLEELEVPPGLQARVEGRRVVVETTDEGTFQVVYRVTNDRGAQATAVLTVYVKQDAELLPPVAEDVVVSPLETLDKAAVEVNVLAVAENPSGPLSDLVVSVPSSQSGIAEVTAAQKVLVQLGPTSRTVPYLLTNKNSSAKGVSTYAFITVPALGDFPPMLRPKTRELKVASGAELVVDLAEYVQVAPGRSPVLTDDRRVSATKSDGSELIVDKNTLRYVSEQNYGGPASITFEVTDGSTDENSLSRRKTLTLPITVYATEAYPPRFQPSLIETPQGEAPIAVDLRKMTTGPEGESADLEQYTYELTSAAPAGFTATLSGSVLSIAADASTQRGTLGSVGVAVYYGGDAPVAGRVEFRASASIRQVPRVNDLIVDGVSGKASVVDVLRDAYNPYPGSPLTVAGVTVETPGAGTATASSSSVSIVPAENFIGEMSVRFRVRDVTNDPSREVEGRIKVRVRSVPEAPRAPRINEVRDRTVVLSWDAPANNAATITSYEVTHSPGGATTTCTSTTCSIGGLTNDVEYTFTVRALNEVGWSPMSAASAKARPDQVPDRPQAPTLTFGDREIRATWPTPNSPGSAVSSYTLQISPAPDSGPATVTTSSTSHTFTGLRNGREYRIQVKAHNSAEGDSGWSDLSARETPVGVPNPPGSVSAAREGDRAIKVKWDATPDTNGAPVTYTLTASGGSNSTWRKAGISPDDRSQSFAANSQFPIENGVDYTFTVTATNKAGESSGRSATSATWTGPDTPGSFRVTADSSVRAYANGAVTFDWSQPSGGGVAIQKYELKISGQDPISVSGTSRTVTGLPGGQAISAKVRAVNVKDISSDWSASVSATPVTVPQAPEISNVSVELEKISFKVQAGDNGGSPVENVSYEVVGGQAPCNTVSTQSGTAAQVTCEVAGSIDSAKKNVTIRAQVTSAVGSSTRTERNVDVPLPTRPSAPSLTSTTTAGTTTAVGSAKVSWTPPNNNGRPIDRYETRYKIGSGAFTAWVKAEQDERFIKIDHPGSSDAPVSVLVEVRAENSIGWGATGQETVTIPPRVPAEPDPPPLD